MSEPISKDVSKDASADIKHTKEEAEFIRACKEAEDYDDWLKKQNYPIDSAHILYRLPLTPAMRERIYNKLKNS